MLYWRLNGTRLYQGHVLDELRAMESESAHCAITSPPYWGLRSYGTSPVVWDGEADCPHEWGEERVITNSAPRDHNGAYAFADTRGQEPHRKGTTLTASQGQFCRLCGAWLGSLGLEPTPDLYVAHLVEVFREVRRVLRSDGTLWLNLGSSYASSTSSQSQSHPAHHADPYGSDDTEPSDYQETGPVCCHCGDEHQGDCQTHQNRTYHNDRALDEDDEHLYKIGHDNGHQDCAQAFADVSVADAQESTIPLPCGRVQGTCVHEDMALACRLSHRTCAAAAQGSVHTAQNTHGTSSPSQTLACHKSDREPSSKAHHTSSGYTSHSIASMFSAVKFKPKDLIPIPWMVAMALQADGWYLRSDIIWAKSISFCDTYSGSCMPESVRDRPTKAHEYVFLLSKSARYFYDQEAVKEASFREGDITGGGKKYQPDTVNDQRTRAGLEALGERPVASTRNLRSVWAINPGNFPGSHFATYPPALVEPMIKAGTSERGCCPRCGKPWERVVEKPTYDADRGDATGKAQHQDRQAAARRLWERTQAMRAATGEHDSCVQPPRLLGWRPGCDCDAGEPEPCTVLDPFGGSGTSAEVAIRLGRRAVLIELSQSYCDEHIIPRLEKPLQVQLLWEDE